jgi:hypothetical protein
MSKGPGKVGMLLFGLVLIVGVVRRIIFSTSLPARRGTSSLAYVLLGIAVLVALGFEFVNRVQDGQCRIVGYLSTLARAGYCGGVVGILELPGVLTSSNWSLLAYFVAAGGS